MVSSQSHSLALDAYHKWRHEDLIQCEDTTEAPSSVFDSFMPKSSIDKFFNDPHRVMQLLARHTSPENLGAVCNAVRQGFSKVCCILLDIKRPDLFEHFVWHPELRDKFLPFSTRPASFPRLHNDWDVWPEFYKKQRVFCPVTLREQGWKVHRSEWVLPIVSRKQLQGGSTADLYRAEIHSEYDKLKPNFKAPIINGHRSVALKAYKGTLDSLSITYAVREAQNFEAIRDRDEVHGLVEFHCAYHHEGLSYLLMEYADEDTLENFFENTDPPTTGPQIIAFWTSLARIVRGLACVHDVKFDCKDEAFSKPLQGWHQDVKPSNVLAFSNSTQGEYRFTFKLGDLGLSHFHAVTHAEQTSEALDGRGTSTYGAPEVYRPSRFYNQSRLQATNKIDIFSIGCVLLEAAVWLIRGKAGLHAFRDAREQENTNNGTNAGDCFHDGERVLKVVETQRQSLKNDTRRSDDITPLMLEDIMKTLRRDPKLRPTALVMSKDLEDRIQEAKKAMNGSQVPSSATAARAGQETEAPQRATFPSRTRSVPSSRSSQSEHVHGKWSVANEGLRPGTPELDGIGEPTDVAQEHVRIDPPLRARSETVPRRQHSRRGQHVGPGAALSIPTAPRHSDALSRDAQTPTSPTAPILTSTPESYRPSEDADLSTLPSLPEPKYVRAPSAGSDQSNAITGKTSPHEPKYSFDDRGHSINRPSEEQAERHVDLIQRPPTSPLPATPSPGRSIPASPALPPAVTSPSANTFKVTLDEILEWRTKCRDRSTKLWRSAPPMPGEHLKPRLKNRDHVLIVDNASTMSDHWDDLIGILDPIFYVLKDCDPDGVEFYWANGGDPQPLRFPSTKEMLSEAEKKRPRPPQGRTDIGVRLDAILADYRLKLDSSNRHHRPRRPMNIYIFTDGIWAAGGDAATPIKRMVRELRKNGLGRNQVGIQFISFGHDVDALQRLAQLDLLAEDREVGMDIVDTEPHHGDFWKMLLGAINTRFDADTQQQAAYMTD